MAIEASEFLKELRASRAGIDPQEKLKQLQELKQRSQSKPPEKKQSIPKYVSPTLIVLGADSQKRKKSDGNEEKSE